MVSALIKLNYGDTLIPLTSIWLIFFIINVISSVYHYFLAKSIILFVRQSLNNIHEIGIYKMKNS